MFQGLYIGLNSFSSLQDGQIAVYAGEGRGGDVLFVYNGNSFLLDSSLQNDNVIP